MRLVSLPEPSLPTGHSLVSLEGKDPKDIVKSWKLLSPFSEVKSWEAPQKYFPNYTGFKLQTFFSTTTLVQTLNL